MENETNVKKTKACGTLPAEKVSTLKGWTDYTAKAAAFSTAKSAAEEAKKAVRAELQTRLKEEDGFDFILDKDGGVRMFINLELNRQRSKSTDRSADF